MMKHHWIYQSLFLLNIKLLQKLLIASLTVRSALYYAHLYISNCAYEAGS